MRIVIPSTALLMILAAAACSSSGSSSSGGTPDAGPTVTTTDASTDDASTEASTPDAADGGCTDLALPSTAAPITQVAATAPTPAGGTIADGTYVLTKVETYTGPGGATGNGGNAYGAARFAGNAIDSILLEGSNPLVTSAGTYVTSGTGIRFQLTCPIATPLSTPIPYTADATHYDSFGSDGTNTIVSTWVKQ